MKKTKFKLLLLGASLLVSANVTQAAQVPDFESLPAGAKRKAVKASQHPKYTGLTPEDVARELGWISGTVKPKDDVEARERLTAAVAAPALDYSKYAELTPKDVAKALEEMEEYLVIRVQKMLTESPKADKSVEARLAERDALQKTLRVAEEEVAKVRAEFEEKLRAAKETSAAEWEGMDESSKNRARVDLRVVGIPEDSLSGVRMSEVYSRLPANTAQRRRGLKAAIESLRAEAEKVEPTAAPAAAAQADPLAGATPTELAQMQATASAVGVDLRSKPDALARYRALPGNAKQKRRAFAAFLRGQ